MIGMIGLELGGRYEIIARIGGGGMALVYKGHDILLNRKVAIKVLRQQFVHDEEFIRRFRREAQSAASLSHPNVVSIYDVGQEDEIHYIVMEYIDGSNLNEVIQERAPLQVEEAVHIASQICDALDHAHHNQIIHRDIKPHNILIGKNGRIKVTDFGIARAATSSTITQTGSVIGSVHYFSPEHAKGVLTGEKSDLYSLGIVMYQMLTAQLPFHGESPISVALKHLQENVEDPRKFNLLIPQSVENIILKSMQKSPEDRYQSAGEMHNDLDTCLLASRRNEPKITFVRKHHGDDEETRVMPAIKPEHLAAFHKSNEEISEFIHSSGQGLNAATGSNPPRNRTWIKPTAWITGTILLLLLMWFGVKYVSSVIIVPEVEVPDVVNLTVDQAREKLKEVGLAVEEPPIYEANEDIPKDVVIAQNKQGMKVKEGSEIKLYISKGVNMVILSDFVGKNYNDARVELVGLDVVGDNIIKEDVFADEEPGTIIQQSPPPNNEINPKKDQVKFTVSKGRETFEMPNLIGYTENEAMAIATRNNLNLPKANVKLEPSYSPKGKVFKQWPYEPNDPVAENSEITIYISSGLPEDALSYTYNVTVSPTVLGQESTIKIVYSDARGDNIEWGTKKLSDTQTFPIALVLSPKKDGVVTVYRDDQLVDSVSITYTDASGGGVEPVTVTPEETPSTEGTNTDTEVNTTPAE